MNVELVDSNRPQHMYQRIASRARQLRDLGLSYYEIGRALGTNHTTARKAATWESNDA